MISHGYDLKPLVYAVNLQLLKENSELLSKTYTSYLMHNYQQVCIPRRTKNIFISSQRSSNSTVYFHLTLNFPRTRLHKTKTL